MEAGDSHWVTVNSSVSATQDNSPMPPVGKLTIDCTRKAASCTGDTEAPEGRPPVQSPCSSNSVDTDTVICMDGSGDMDMPTLIRNCAQDVQYISRGIAHSAGAVGNGQNTSMIERLLERTIARLSLVPWHVSSTTILTTAPERIVVPEICTSDADSVCSTRNMMQRTYRRVCSSLLRQFSDLSVSEPDGFRVLTLVDRVHLTGRYMRRGPLLWAQTDDDMYVLARLELWPVHDAGCLSFCCPVCWGDSQGVCDFLVNAEQIVSAAEVQLGLNPYRGYCGLPWCW